MGDPSSVLQTERLALRPYRLDDIDDLAVILGDEQTMRYYPSPFTREQSLEWITRNLERYDEDGFGLWAMVLKKTGEFVGNCGPVKRLVDQREEVELGWHVKKTYWRQGLACEAAAACRDYCFSELGLRRLIALVRPENIPSKGVAEKIGMSVEKRIEWGSLGLPHLVYVTESR